MARSVFVDSNVVIDVASLDPVWMKWSEEKLIETGSRGALIINAAVYAEISANFPSVEDAGALLNPYNIHYEDIPREAAFLAGKAHSRYRRRGGARKSVLADFLIGAHAAVRGLPLLTRDRAGYAAYFPELEIIAPDLGPAVK